MSQVSSQHLVKPTMLCRRIPRSSAVTKVHATCGFCRWIGRSPYNADEHDVIHFPMELAADIDMPSAIDFPTATPVLDVLRPLPNHGPVRLTTSDYFFVSSAVIVAFTEMPVVRQFLDALSRRSALEFWTGLLALPIVAFVAAISVHAAGHLLAGRLAGFEAVRIKFGRLMLRDRLESTDVLSLGSIVMRPHGAERLRRRLAWLVSGGPLASLLAPLLLETVLRLTQNYGARISFLAADGIHLFSVVSLLLGIGALLPDIDSSGNFSDGTRLLMLLENDCRASRLVAMLELELVLRSGETPRTGDEDLIARTVGQRDESFDTVAANWLAYLWASQRQDLETASKCLEEALADLANSPGHLRDRIFLEAAVFQAWYRHNVVKARLWESQILHPHALPLVDRKRLEIACCWSEGRSFDAWEQLARHLNGLRELPESSTRDSAERDALEWKAQMESRMLSGAWATMHSWPYRRQTQRVM